MPAIPKLHRLWFTSAGDVHLRVLVAGWCTIGDWWHERHVQQPFWRLYANDAPGAEIELADGEIVPLDPGSIWLLPAGLTFSSRTNQDVGHVWIHFDPVGLSPGGLRQLAARPIAISNDVLVGNSCTALRDVATSTSIHDVELRCLAKSLGYLAFSRWWRGLDQAATNRLLLATSDPELAPALLRIDSDVAAPLYNESLARSCKLSISTFVRRFHAAVGISPAQYILERRIAMAAELLLMGRLNIDAVAEAVGFSDRFYFSRVFTKRMQCTPAAYRDYRPTRPVTL